MTDDSSFFPFGDLQATAQGAASRYTGYEPLWEGHLTRVGRVRSLDRRWIVKSVIEKFRGVPECELRLEKEFKLLSTLSHPGIVRCFEYTDIPGLGPSIVMEEVEGVTLSEWLESPHPRCKRRQVARALLEAMAYAHSRGVMHLDLKPDNVMVRTDGNSRMSPVCILDFGLADSPQSLSLKAVGGTPRYSAPEQLITGYRATPRADVYSLGLLLRMIRPGLSLSLAARIAMRLKPERRPRDAKAMWAAARRMNVLACAGAAFLAAGACACGYLYLQQDKPAPQQTEAPAAPTVKTEAEEAANSDTATPGAPGGREATPQPQVISAPISPQEAQGPVTASEQEVGYDMTDPRIPLDEKAHDELIAELTANAIRCRRQVEQLTLGMTDAQSAKRMRQALDMRNALAAESRARMQALTSGMSVSTLKKHDRAWATPYCEPYSTAMDSLDSFIARSFLSEWVWTPNPRSAY